MSKCVKSVFGIVAFLFAIFFSCGLSYLPNQAVNFASQVASQADNFASQVTSQAVNFASQVTSQTVNFASQVTSQADQITSHAEHITSQADNFASQAETATENQRILTVIMYHQILKNSTKSKYIVTPVQFENDLIELKKRGYDTVLPTDLINFVENGTPLPPKPLMITFDDGHFNNIFYGQPLLQKHNCKAVLNIVGAYSEFSTNGEQSNPNYSHITWEQIQNAHHNGTFEIGNHTYNLHKFKPRKGIGKLANETQAKYLTAIKSDVERLQNVFADRCGFTPVCFAYPFGIYNKVAKNMLTDLGFKVIFNCYERNNLVCHGKPDTLTDLCRFNRDSSYSCTTFFNKIANSPTA